MHVQASFYQHADRVFDEIDHLSDRVFESAIRLARTSAIDRQVSKLPGPIASTVLGVPSTSQSAVPDMSSGIECSYSQGHARS